MKGSARTPGHIKYTSGCVEDNFWSEVLHFPGILGLIPVFDPWGESDVKTGAVARKPSLWYTNGTDVTHGHCRLFLAVVRASSTSLHGVV